MSMRIFYQIHRWVSLVCALFFLMLAVTGLPMLFRDQLRAWNTVNLPPASAPMPQAEIWNSLPEGFAAIEAYFPNKEVLAVTPNAADGTLHFSVQTRGVKSTARTHMRMGGEQIMYDVRTGNVFNRKDRIYRFTTVESMLHWAHLLHTQLGSAGMAGKHFLALMCILAVLSILSGLFLYGPMMKGIALGTLRRGSTRMRWSDWHKFVSVFALVFAVVLCVSGVMIAAYSAGVKHYHRDAHMAAMTALSDLPAAETALSPAEAYRTVHEAFPDKIIISMQVPQGTNKNYAFHAADPPTKPTNFVLDEMVFLPKSGDAAPLFVPAPAWMHITPLFLNLHIHNHDWIALKIAWAALLLLTIAMIVSGCVLLATRRFNTIHRGTARPVHRTNASVWRAPAAIAVLSMAGLLAPIEGGIGNAVGLAALGLPLIYFARLLRR